MRIYNPALGRFLSVDPLFKSFSFYSPYQFAGNTPIMAIDLDGLEVREIVTKKSDGTILIHRIITLKSLNSSRLKENQINDKIEEYKKSIIDSYSGRYCDGNGNAVIYSAEVSVTPVLDQSEIDPFKDFYIEWVNRIGLVAKGTLGKTDFIGDVNVNRIRIRADLKDFAKKVAVHETGHAFGLEHGSKATGYKSLDGMQLDADNAMIVSKTDSKGASINYEQQQKISENLEQKGLSTVIDETQPTPETEDPCKNETNQK